MNGEEDDKESDQEKQNSGWEGLHWTWWALLKTSDFTH